MQAMKHPFSGRTGIDRDVGFEYRRKLGNYVRDHREKAGLTQREVGRAVGLSANAVSAIELGRNPIPPERYRSFADVFSIPHKVFAKYLMEYTDPWLFGLMYGEEKVAKHNLGQLPTRFRDTTDDL